MFRPYLVIFRVNSFDTLYKRNRSVSKLFFLKMAQQGRNM
jgi:hypothetical protein